MTKIFIASDHAGVELKSKLVFDLGQKPFSQQYEVHDLGPHSSDSVDYPDYADQVCKKIHGFTLIDSNDGKKTHPIEMGILICGSGQGMAMRANRYPHIRAALCFSLEQAKLAREHNDANVLCLGARVVDANASIQIMHTFLATPFAAGRHSQRVVKLSTPV